MTDTSSNAKQDIVIRIGKPQARVLSLLLVLVAVSNGEQHIGEFFGGVFEGYAEGQARHAPAQGGFVDSAIDSDEKSQKAHHP